LVCLGLCHQKGQCIFGRDTLVKGLRRNLFGHEGQYGDLIAGFNIDREGYLVFKGKQPALF